MDVTYEDCPRLAADVAIFGAYGRCHCAKGGLDPNECWWPLHYVGLMSEEGADERADSSAPDDTDRREVDGERGQAAACGAPIG